MKDKYVIGYCYWEADELPEPYKNSIAYLQEIWTPSRYCVNVFSRHHNLVTYMPFAIERDTACSEEDRRVVNRLIEYEPDCIYYLTITKVVDKRKNVETLVKGFLNSCDRMAKVRLIIKARASDPLAYVRHPQIVYLANDLTESQLNALYHTCHAYVSAHHAEAWGLTLSDAMLFRKPVIATGYSGNLEFMNQDNSFLVDFKERRIRWRDRTGLFARNMKWAYPVREDLEAKMLLLYESLNEGWVKSKIDRATIDIQGFDRQAVCSRLETRLRQI